MPIEKIEFKDEEIYQHKCEQRKTIEESDRVVIERKILPELDKRWRLYFDSDDWYETNIIFCPFCGEKLPA